MPLKEVVEAIRTRQAEARAIRLMEARRLADGFAQLGVQKVILFGSSATGQDGQASDLDLVVITEVDDTQPFGSRLAPELAALRPSVPVDLLVYTPDEWDALRSESSFARDEIVDKGVLLFER